MRVPKFEDSKVPVQVPAMFTTGPAATSEVRVGVVPIPELQLRLAQPSSAKTNREGETGRDIASLLMIAPTKAPASSSGAMARAGVWRRVRPLGPDEKD